MSKVNTFPVQVDRPYNGGMDLRDYFAARAMTVLLHPSMTAHMLHETFDTVSISDASYMIADEMLRARETKSRGEKHDLR